ncbi:Negative regulatory protein yxlD [Alkalihalobacillus pseudalcaliphilus]|nr:hypothetical protein [Alkalihalobacillus pseudalcaliphilus]KMK76621.1 Negative regulatory protein yxlD [Alkalihalobacillus pseudalcaliphilus]
MNLYVLIPFIAAILLTQSILLFIDAKKRNKYPWFWGLWGLIQAPTPTLFYLLFIYISKRRQIKRMEE